jgi:membrane-associated phospholipid phosphatase
VSRPLARLALGFVALLLVGWGVGELWLSIVGSGELDFVREVAAQRSAALTSAARVVTWAGSAWLLVPLALACCAALVRAGLRREALVLALSLGGAMLLSDLIKQLVSRPRPPIEHLQRVTGSSFPSGHATQASAFWFSLVLVLRAAGASRPATRLAAGLAVALVLAVAASRVYLGVHYPSDVVAGMLLGASWTACVWNSVPARREPRAGRGAPEGTAAPARFGPVRSSETRTTRRADRHA